MSDEAAGEDEEDEDDEDEIDEEDDSSFMINELGEDTLLGMPSLPGAVASLRSTVNKHSSWSPLVKSSPRSDNLFFVSVSVVSSCLLAGGFSSILIIIIWFELVCVQFLFSFFGLSVFFEKKILFLSSSSSSEIKYCGEY